MGSWNQGNHCLDILCILLLKVLGCGIIILETKTLVPCKGIELYKNTIKLETVL